MRIMRYDELHQTLLEVMAVTTVADLERSAKHIRDGAASVGKALDSVDMQVSPALARSIQAEHNLYDRVDGEFGLLTSHEAGMRLGSRSSTPRNRASQLRKSGRLVGLERGGRTLFPGFQFGSDGQPLPVIADLLALARSHKRSETGLVQWLCSPTTYLNGARPVELLGSAPERVMDVASEAWSVEW